jgi:hypothetical protein
MSIIRCQKNNDLKSIIESKIQKISKADFFIFELCDFFTIAHRGQNELTFKFFYINIKFHYFLYKMVHTSDNLRFIMTYVQWWTFNVFLTI